MIGLYEMSNLIRIGIFSKEAIDTNGFKNNICFQAVGNSVKFYIISLTEKQLYIMFEFAHIHVPMSLEDLPSFIAQSDKLMQIISCTKNIYSQQKTELDSSWKASPNFNAYVYSSRTVKRPRTLIF
jgi:hypothetical protein